MKKFNFPVGLLTSLLILLVLTATACNETPPNNDKPEDDQKRKTTAPIATIQKEFLLAALKMDDLDEKTVAQYKKLVRVFQEQEDLFLKFGKKQPEASNSLFGKIIRLCPCMIDPDFIRLCPCPTPVPPTIGGLYDDLPTYDVYVSAGRGPEQLIKPEIIKLEQGIAVNWDINSVKYEDKFTVTIRDKNGVSTSMTMVRDGKEWFRQHPFVRE
ncbi:MAG: hypothetical protein AAFV80_21820 [Bacteroidota bacterium]